jgi:hypothetical protein
VKLRLEGSWFQDSSSKKSSHAIIPTTSGRINKRIIVQGIPGTRQDLKITRTKKGLSKCKSLNSNHSTAKRNDEWVLNFIHKYLYMY